MHARFPARRPFEMLEQIGSLEVAVVYFSDALICKESERPLIRDPGHEWFATIWSISSAIAKPFGYAATHAGPSKASAFRRDNSMNSAGQTVRMTRQPIENIGAEQSEKRPGSSRVRERKQRCRHGKRAATHTMTGIGFCMAPWKWKGH